MNLVCVGELLVDMLPAESDKHLTEVSAFAPKPGGAPANVAVAAARLDTSVAFIGKVGEDPFGHWLAELLRREKVETRGLRFDREARTTLAFIAQRADANDYLFYRNPGADQRLRPDELDDELISQAAILHVGSVSLSDEPSRSATFEAVRRARAGKARVSFDVNFRPALWRSPEDAAVPLATMVPLADILKVNASELELLSKTDDPDRGSARLLARGPKLVVVTLGANGSYFRTATKHGHVPAFKVDAVDSTGCGDSFMGALLAQLIRVGSDNTDAQLEDILRYANAAGAITASRRGAIPALPTAIQVRDFLKEVMPKIGLLEAEPES